MTRGFFGGGGCTWNYLHRLFRKKTNVIKLLCVLFARLSHEAKEKRLHLTKNKVFHCTVALQGSFDKLNRISGDPPYPRILVRLDIFLFPNLKHFTSKGVSMNIFQRCTFWKLWIPVAEVYRAERRLC